MRESIKSSWTSRAHIVLQQLALHCAEWASGQLLCARLWPAWNILGTIKPRKEGNGPSCWSLQFDETAAEAPEERKTRPAF